jgi:hypothetical protein
MIGGVKKNVKLHMRSTSYFTWPVTSLLPLLFYNNLYTNSPGFLAWVQPPPSFELLQWAACPCLAVPTVAH